jgi:AcrR family transcriptional regulator
MSDSVRNSNKARRHEAILATARELFQKEGIHNTSIEKLASVMNLGKGTVYNYFPSKDEIYAQIVLSFNDRLVTALTRSQAAEPVMLQLRSLIRTYIRHHLDDTALTRIVLECKSAVNWHNLSEMTRSQWRRQIEIRHELVSSIIQGGIDEDILWNKDVADLTIVGVSMLEGVVRNLIIEHERYPSLSYENLVHLAEEILIKGLRV